jgi:hypothetical protein
VAAILEYHNENSASITGGKFADQLNDYQLLKKDFAVWSYKSIPLFP